MRIGELSSKSGVSRDALRLYERQGMIASVRRPNGYRDYHENTVALVGMIKLAQSIGFRLSEIAPEMRVIAQHGLGTDDVARLLVQKLGEVDARIKDLSNRRNELAKMLEKVCPLNRSGVIVR